MRHLAFLLPAFILAAICAHAQRGDSLYRLYQAKLFPALNAANNKPGHPYYWFYKAVYANACNKPDSSLYYLKQHTGKRKKPEDAIAFEYYSLEHDNYVRSFRFETAASTGKQLLKKYRKRYKEDEIKGNGYANMIWKALAKEPVQKVEQPPLDSIPFTRDLAGLINLPVKTSNAEASFIFDTGAGLSCITDTYAEKFGLKILPDSGIQVAGFNNIYNPVRIGIAPEIQIGNITVYNEPFLVFRDEAFSFANGAYRINGIIGFPIAKELGRIIIAPKQLILEKHETEDLLLERNFFMETLHPILILNYKGKPYPFNFDTGANASSFSKPLFDADSSALLEAGRFTTRNSGSAGGVTSARVLEVPSLEFELNNQPVSILKPHIETERYHVSGEKLYGNIGQDLLRQYRRVIIDFKNSHFRLEKN